MGFRPISSKGMVLLCLVLTTVCNSQTINTNYKALINQKLGGLDKSRIPSKLLINQAMEFAELEDYNGTLTATNFTTKGKYTSVYNTLLMARVQQNVSGLISPTDFKKNWDILRQPNKIVLSGLYYRYNKIK